MRGRRGGKREGGRERYLPVQRHVEVWQRTLHTEADRSVHQGSVWKHPLLLIGSMTHTIQEADSGQETKAEGRGEKVNYMAGERLVCGTLAVEKRRSMSSWLIQSHTAE